MQQLIEQFTNQYGIKEEVAVGIFETIKLHVAENFPALGNTLDFVFTNNKILQEPMGNTLD